MRVPVPFSLLSAILRLDVVEVLIMCRVLLVTERLFAVFLVALTILLLLANGEVVCSIGCFCLIGHAFLQRLDHIDLLGSVVNHVECLITLHFLLNVFKHLSVLFFPNFKLSVVAFQSTVVLV